jgi:UDP-N-acetylglucosamine 2-epimerase (non-hydrolysing)
MRKLKVVTVIGTRPEIIRLSRIMTRLDECCEHLIIHTGQNYDYELNKIFFDELELRKPDFFLNIANPNTGAADYIGLLISSVDKILAKTNPDAMLVLGDTNSTLSVIPAKRRKIPIFHMEAGNRSFDQRVPEEINRKIVDHTADINMTYSSIAREYLLREGLPPDFIIKIGSPMSEVLNYYKNQINSSSILSKLGLIENEYFLVSAHREENIDSPKLFNQFIDMLNLLATDYQKPIIVSTHPRTQNKISSANLNLNSMIRFMKPFGFFDYIKLQISSITVLSDSGTINEESSILNFPAINIREATERPEAMEEGSVMMAGLNIERIKQILFILTKQSRGEKRDINIVSDYDVQNVSDKLIRIIHSYTDYVNRIVWRKF